MSYSERYTANVQFSGSVSYSYPASQSGGSGSAHYSGTVPISVVIHVDTRPFDGSVKSFNHSVDALTGSVVAMNAAQCAAIHQTAVEVSESLTTGFFGLINTELSQQIQALDSAIKANFGLIAEQSKAVSDKNHQMENDYNRISSRYVNLFTDLDTECYKRIYALDKQSFVLSEKVQQQLLSETSRNNAALNFLGIEEVSSSKVFVFVSAMNRRVIEVLRTLYAYIGQEEAINTLVNSLLADETIDQNISIYIPAVWLESDSIESGNEKKECFMTDNIDQQQQSTITDKIDSFCTGQTLWSACDEQEKDALNREFKALSESSFSDINNETEQRIYQTMVSLWHDSQITTLKRRT